MKIRGKDIILSERSAKDVLDLADFYKKNPPDNEFGNLIIIAAVIEASLRATRNKLSWYDFKRFRYKKYKIKFLLKYLSQAELTELYQDVFLLEGFDLKKKIVQEASQE